MEQRGSKCSRLPTYGMSTAHGDLSGRAGGRANAGSVVGSTAGRARDSRHRASRRRARRGVRNSYRDGARTRTASAAKVSFAINARIAAPLSPSLSDRCILLCSCRHCTCVCVGGCRNHSKKEKKKPSRPCPFCPPPRTSLYRRTLLSPSGIIVFFFCRVLYNRPLRR